jgi:integrase
LFVNVFLRSPQSAFLWYNGRYNDYGYNDWYNERGQNMSKQAKGLTALKVEKLKIPGRYADGGGLYLEVKETGAKSWLFRFAKDGKRTQIGLGSTTTLSLLDAREKAAQCRRTLIEGSDPLAERKAIAVQRQIEAARTKTFRQCALAYIDAHRSGWRNAKHAAQWTNTLTTHAFPLLGELPVQKIDTDLTVQVLEPLWKDTNETARRVRGRIEAILDWATVKKYRQGDNPARWRGNLEKLLSKRSTSVRHQPALDYNKIGAFMAALKEQNGMAADALAFTILTASRTSEVLGARWAEIDLAKALWTVPASRIKTKREHTVTLSLPAMAILHRLKEHADKNPWVFLGERSGKPLSGMAMLMLLRRMNRADITVHGFRSTFRDWAAEQTNYPREVAEAALAHISGDKVERAYRRTDFLEKRRQMLEAWGRYCMTPSLTAAQQGEVVPLRRG